MKFKNWYGKEVVVDVIFDHDIGATIADVDTKRPLICVNTPFSPKTKKFPWSDEYEETVSKVMAYIENCMVKDITIDSQEIQKISRYYAVETGRAFS